MPFARDYRFNTYTSGVGEEVAILESFDIRTRLFALKTPGGFEFRMHDDLNYPDIIACADWDKLLGMLSQGMPLPKLTRPKTILKAVPHRLLRGLKRADRNEVAEELARVFKRWYLGFGVLDPLLRSEVFNDIVVDSPGPDGSAKVYVRGGHYGDAYHPLIIEPNQCPNRDDEPKRGLFSLFSIFKQSTTTDSEQPPTFNEYILDRSSELTRTPVTSYAPAGMATYTDLRLRITMLADPISKYTVAFRKHPSSYWTLPKLIALGSITPALAAKLLVATTGDPNWVENGRKLALLAIGEMGSGKTTLTAALANTLPPDERVAFIQDVDEYQPIPIRSEVPLNTRSATGLGVREITKADLIAYSMRVGAQYLTVNEVLSPEDARAWVLAILSGHGGFTTYHTDSRENLIERLSSMGITNVESIVNRNIIIVLMVNKKAKRVWWPRGLKWCPNQEPCVEEPPFEARPYPEELANALIKASQNFEDYEAIRQVWLEYRGVTAQPVSIITEGGYSSGQQQWGSGGFQAWFRQASNSPGGS
jgi:type IV secretory pathway ATPase VirB11/archaellum biosynthesis ATPase